jgi:hypothetical protein
MGESTPGGDGPPLRENGFSLAEATIDRLEARKMRGTARTLMAI